MAGLCWMSVVLVFSLTVGNTEAMDQNDVKTIAKYILDTYFIPYSQFSLAANIPENQDLKKLQDLFNTDDAKIVKNMVQSGKVYTSNNMVEATHLRRTRVNRNQYTEHAEARVLAKIQPLADNSAGKSLFFYSYLSPCGKKCTNPNNPNNILEKIDNIPNDRWEDSAFVFSKVFNRYKDQNGKYVYFALDEIKNALKNLGATKFGYDNIFRCDSNKRQFKCIKCFPNESPEPVNGRCVKN